MRWLASLGTILCVFVASVSVAGAQTSGLAYREDTVFTVGEDSVEVLTTAVMTNTTSERRRGNTIYYTYFDEALVVVPKGAQDLSIVSRGRALSGSVNELDEAFDLHMVRLPSNLRSGQSRTMTIRFTLPRGEIRTDGIFFSNPAFHTFPMWSFSDPGTGSLTLRVPKGAVVSDLGDVMVRSGDADGYVEWTPRNFEQPAELFTVLTVTIEDALIVDRFVVSEQDIELRTWPGDDEWAEFAKETIEVGLPALEALIGSPIPDQSTLEITESVTPYFYGYAGWYDPYETSIEVGSDLEDSVMLHELSHAWFNRDLFIERWVSEGLAEEFTWQAQQELGWETEDLPTKPRSTDRSAIPLATWTSSIIGASNDQELRDREEFGYNASFYVMHEIVEVVGVENMQEVIAAASDNTPSYPGTSADEVTNKADDWRRLLDLLALNIDREEEEKLDELFVDHVVTERHAEAIATRRPVRDAYLSFLDREPGWRTPDELRVAMGLWDFVDAQAILDDANDVLDLRDEVLEQVEKAGLELSDASRIPFEADDPDFDAVRRVLEEQRSSIAGVELVRETVELPLTTEERWGIGEIDLMPFATYAEAAYAVDDTEAIADAQRRLEITRERIAVAGATRIKWTKIGGGSGVAIVLLGAVMVIRRVRRPDPIIDEVVLAA